MIAVHTWHLGAPGSAQHGGGAAAPQSRRHCGAGELPHKDAAIEGACGRALQLLTSAGVIRERLAATAYHTGTGAAGTLCQGSMWRMLDCSLPFNGTGKASALAASHGAARPAPAQPHDS
jgi:hypothetical protein